jgi:hypothetical protein
MSKANDESKTAVKSETKTEADVVWEQIKKTPISMFGLAPKPLQDISTRINVMPDKIHLSLNAPSAAVAMIEDALNVRRDGQGAEVRINAFDVETIQNGMLVISRKNTTK